MNIRKRNIKTVLQQSTTLPKLVYYIGFNSIEEAIAEEKRIKGGSRKNKIILIESINPNWDDLYNQL